MPLQIREDGSGKYDTGRPSDYKPEYCKMLIDFFSIEPTRDVDTVYERGQTKKTETKVLPNDFPTLERFCSNIGCDTSTLVRWSKDYPDFHSAYTRAKQLQKDNLIRGAMSGVYDSRFSQFVAINATDMRDKVQLTGSEDGPVIIQIVPPASSGAEIEVKVEK